MPRADHGVLGGVRPGATFPALALPPQTHAWTEARLLQLQQAVLAGAASTTDSAEAARLREVDARICRALAQLQAAVAAHRRSASAREPTDARDQADVAWRLAAGCCLAEAVGRLEELLVAGDSAALHAATHSPLCDAAREFAREVAAHRCGGPLEALARRLNAALRAASDRPNADSRGDAEWLRALRQLAARCDGAAVVWNAAAASAAESAAPHLTPIGDAADLGAQDAVASGLSGDEAADATEILGLYRQLCTGSATAERVRRYRDAAACRDAALRALRGAAALRHVRLAAWVRHHLCAESIARFALALKRAAALVARIRGYEQFAAEFGAAWPIVERLVLLPRLLLEDAHCTALLLAGVEERCSEFEPA
jgi:hypothetical protein